MGTIPIVLFVYNRPDHLRRTIEALVKNTLAEKSKLFIYSDGPKNQIDAEKVMSVRKYIHSISGFKEVEIIEREKNYGLAKSVITGISEVFNSSSKVIVMEDDMISSHGFLSYMYELLNFYENNRTIFSVTGYTFPIKIPYDYPYEIYLNDSFYGMFKKDDNIFIPDNSNVTIFISQTINSDITKSYDVGKTFLTLGIMYFLGFFIVIVLIVVGIRKIWRR